ncbi:MAG: hypothetical protein PHF31_06935 [Methylobacter sp.]|nr:hypothetical protein [Methylobacter sp.]
MTAIYRTEKALKIANTLERITTSNSSEILAQVSSIIIKEVEFYDGCYKSWDNPSSKFSQGEIEIGRQCCLAGLDMADAIVNELRIMFFKKPT